MRVLRYLFRDRPEARILLGWGLPASRYRSKLRDRGKFGGAVIDGRGKFITVIELNPGLRRGSGFYATPVPGHSKSIFFLPARDILWQS